MRRGFTLIELLVVIGIMGLLGTASVGGYRQMQRGMEERGVMQNVNQFIRSAYQRAQIDRQPCKVFFWNETLRSSDENENEIVVGKAVAVRRHGRITRISSGKNTGSQLLVDEFGDLNLSYPTGADEDEDSESGVGSSHGTATIRLYKMDMSERDLKYSNVNPQADYCSPTEVYLTYDPTLGTGTDSVGSGRMKLYGFAEASGGGGTASWKIGDSYGFEFQSIELPHGYIFGSSFSSSVNNPVKEVDTLVFKPGSNGSSGTSGKSTISVSSLRPGSSGTLSAQQIGTSDSPTKDLN